MAYDSKTYGQSPFGNPQKADKKADEERTAKDSPKTIDTSFEPIDDGLDQSPFQPSPAPAGLPSQPTTNPPTHRSPNSPPASPPINPPANGNTGGGPIDRLAGRLGLKRTDAPSATPDLSSPLGKTKRKSRTTTPSAPKPTTSTPKKATKSARKSKKAKAAEAAQAEAEAAQAAVDRRFREENQSAYFSLIYKTGISALVWAVLRLLRHELSQDAIAIINIIIHPLLVSACALVAVIGLTFWLRHLLNDLARHTQKLTADAEEPDGKNYRPTLDIVGDSLEYNPKLRKNFALLFDAASILICTLVSYLITSAVLP